MQLSNAGTYSVVVSNSLGTATSSNAVLTVNPLVCVSPASGLVSWWRGESNALDQVGGNSGNLLGGAGFASGKVGQGFNFNGTSGYVQVPSSASLNLTNEITLECWYKDQGATVWYALMAKRSTPGGVPSAANFGLHINPAGGEGVEVFFFDANLGTYGVSDYLPVPASGVFHHIAATFKQVDAGHVLAGDALHLPAGERLGVESDSALGAPERNVDHRRLPRHGFRQGAHFVGVHRRVVAQPAFGRPAHAAVLDAVADEDFERAVVEPHRNLHADLAEGNLEQHLLLGRQTQPLGGQLEVAVNNLAGIGGGRRAHRAAPRGRGIGGAAHSPGRFCPLSSVPSLFGEPRCVARHRLWQPRSSSGPPRGAGARV